MAGIKEAAEEVRRQSLDRIVARPGMREATRATLLRIDDACRYLVERRADLTVVSIVRAIGTLHHGNSIAEQTFYNKTPTGACYREIIAIWKTYEKAINAIPRSRTPINVEDDLPDILLNQLKREGARVIVMAMRTSLRNLRRQLVTLRSLTPDKLVRHRAPPVDPPGNTATALELTREEVSILTAFMDPIEVSSRGAEWDDLGRLLCQGTVLSRPGTLQILRKIVNAIGSPKLEGQSQNDRRK